MYKYNFWIYYLPFTRQTSQGNLVLICPVCLEPGQMKLSHMQHYLMSACRMVLGWAIHWFDCWQNCWEKSRSRNQNKCTSDSMRHISQLSKASKWAEMQKSTHKQLIACRPPENFLYEGLTTYHSAVWGWLVQTTRKKPTYGPIDTVSCIISESSLIMM
jgi:hypothetical protein